MYWLKACQYIELVTTMHKPTDISTSPGQLFYVMGASGAGKDSLMLYARQQLIQEPVVFAHRYITRPIELNGENHIQLSSAEFATRLAHECFKFHWHSHGLEYGIGIEVDGWLQQGLNVVMNGSRGYFDQACALHSDLIPVLIHVDASLLRERLLNRGRETPTQIEARIERAREFDQLNAPNIVRVNNSGSLEQGGDALVKLLQTRA